MQIKITVSSDIKAICHKNSKAVGTAFEGAWSQSKCAVACRRALAEAGLPMPDPKKDQALHAKVLQVLLFFSNSSAVRQQVFEAKTEKPSLAADYANIA